MRRHLTSDGGPLGRQVKAEQSTSSTSALKRRRVNDWVVEVAGNHPDPIAVPAIPARTSVNARPNAQVIPIHPPTSSAGRSRKTRDSKTEMLAQSDPILPSQTAQQSRAVIGPLGASPSDLVEAQEMIRDLQQQVKQRDVWIASLKTEKRELMQRNQIVMTMLDIFNRLTRMNTTLDKNERAAREMGGRVRRVEAAVPVNAVRGRSYPPNGKASGAKRVTQDYMQKRVKQALR